MAATLRDGSAESRVVRGDPVGRDEVLGFIGGINRHFAVPEFNAEFYK